MTLATNNAPYWSAYRASQFTAIITTHWNPYLSTNNTTYATADRTTISTTVNESLYAAFTAA